MTSPITPSTVSATAVDTNEPAVQLTEATARRLNQFKHFGRQDDDYKPFSFLIDGEFVDYNIFFYQNGIYGCIEAPKYSDRASAAEQVEKSITEFLRKGQR